MSVLSMIGLVDAISYMAVAPSLIFYVLQLGGDKEMYGIIMSAFSLASFCGKPLYGIWVDKAGNKFRTPYIASFLLAIFGALLYFFGNAIGSPRTAVAMILVGRLFSGLGGANQALGFAYLALAVPHDQQTRTSTILSMTRIMGMALGPAVNLFLSKIDTTITIAGFSMAIDSLNSVGLLLAGGNLFVMICVILFLEEPPPKEKKLPEALMGMGAAPTPQKNSMWKAFLNIEIWLPIFILLVVNSSFQLVETAFPPAAADGLKWGPIQTSAVLGGSSIVIFACMILTIFLSGKIHDFVMVAIGNLFWILGGTGMYLFWQRDASTWHFVAPIVIACAGFPFISAANRSNFTKAVAAEPALEESVALMQSVLSMAASVAGFITPGLVAAYVIRSPEQVTASADNRELTPVALYVPILPFFVLGGLWVAYRKQQKAALQKQEHVASEVTGLLAIKGRRRSSVVTITQAFSRQSQVNSRISAQIMGMTAFDTHDEKEWNDKLQHDLDEWIQLSELDYDEEKE